MTDPSTPRLQASLVALNPEVGGHDNVQDAIAAGGGGGVGDERLSAFPAAPVDISSGTAVIPWTLDTGAGTDVTIDGGDATKIHLAVGTYLVQEVMQVTGGTATAALCEHPNPLSGTIAGLDGQASLASGGGATVNPLISAVVYWIRVTATAVVTFPVQATGATGGETVNGGIDIVRIA